jgi:hypothetical protein
MRTLVVIPTSNGSRVDRRPDWEAPGRLDLGLAAFAPPRSERCRHCRDPRRAKDRAGEHVGHIVHAQRHAGEPDAQHHHHREEDCQRPPRPSQFGEEHQQEHRVGNHRGLRTSQPTTTANTSRYTSEDPEVLSNHLTK